ncbi:hypothetical protein [Alicyclobacillus acidocaldarius]|uniref:LexA repressor DNA-binding domain-containing protein n=1 Tax=Alicyclobacillus acidocaldarius subsp. acidocaldarius (strain ATCC 27009 / DSM 446 / BCRC 14685 / JCM 5260 / KCTC 1825 / NBRC 15652 / NCIMB 11725 / NRRL B-14509 / 104-IA) TaxID=521098 RepID=C8WYE2_ALIAD|nr:hypothetical protein [Alicyclobacillus acidocaldarius]ACV60036.1 hypothetical protein Aaci_3033 [Alicyclobacillus acidocaldarius subsp. acidocaldarius DSM 446]
MANTMMYEAVAAKLREFYEAHQRPIGPTEIGLALGFSYQQASARTSPMLKRLVAEGTAKRTPNGMYLPVLDANMSG